MDTVQLTRPLDKSCPLGRVWHVVGFPDKEFPWVHQAIDYARSQGVSIWNVYSSRVVD